MEYEHDEIVITSRMSNTKSAVSAIVSFLICCALFFCLSQAVRYHQYIRQVKWGYTGTYPNITFEDAFDSFFAFPRWSYSRDNDGNDIVTFTGECQYYGKPATVQLQYELHPDNTFTLISGSIDGVPQNMYMVLQLNSKPFEEYR